MKKKRKRSADSMLINDLRLAVSMYAKKYPKSTVLLRTQGETFAMALVTEFMRNCHMNFKKTKEFCFVDLTVHKNMYCYTPVIFFLGLSPIGPIPLGMVFLSEEDIDSIICGFQLLKEALGSSAFHGNLHPSFFMSGDSDIVRKALKVSWPEAQQLLCSTYLLYSMLTWLSQENTCMYPKQDKLKFLSTVKNLTYATTRQEFLNTYSSFMKGPLSKHEIFKRYIEDYFTKVQKWGHAYQKDCVFTMYLVKSIVKNRCYDQSTTTFIMSMCEELCCYLQKRYLDCILGNKETYLNQDILDSYTFIEKSDQVFEVQNKQLLYSQNKIDFKVGMCTCIKNLAPCLCSHLVTCAEINMFSIPENIVKSPIARKSLSKIAQTEELPSLKFLSLKPCWSTSALDIQDKDRRIVSQQNVKEEEFKPEVTLVLTPRPWSCQSSPLMLESSSSVHSHKNNQKLNESYEDIFIIEIL